MQVAVAQKIIHIMAILRSYHRTSEIKTTSGRPQTYMKLVKASSNREMTDGKNRALISMVKGYRNTPHGISVSASTRTMHTV